MNKNKHLRYTLILATALAGNAQAQPAASNAGVYPNRPVRFVGAFAPDASTDIVGHITGAKLTVLWGQNVVIESRPGADGNIGTQIGARANPGGSTILMNSSVSVVNVGLYAKPGYAAADFMPDSKEKLDAFSLEFTPSASAQLAAVIKEKIARYAQMLKQSGAKTD